MSVAKKRKFHFQNSDASMTHELADRSLEKQYVSNVNSMRALEAMIFLHKQGCDRYSAAKILTLARPDLGLGIVNALIYLCDLWRDDYCHSDEQKAKMLNGILKKFPNALKLLEE
jgi:hypothetical protein